MASSKEMMKRAAAKRAAARIPTLNAGEFKVGRTTVVAGQWVGWDEGPYYIRSLVCDNKFDGFGFCAYNYNEYYPNGHEAGMANTKNVWILPQDEIDELPADVVRGANKFLKLARSVNFE